MWKGVRVVLCLHLVGKLFRRVFSACKRHNVHVSIFVKYMRHGILWFGINLSKSFPGREKPSEREKSSKFKWFFIIILCRNSQEMHIIAGRPSSWWLAVANEQYRETNNICFSTILCSLGYSSYPQSGNTLKVTVCNWPFLIFKNFPLQCNIFYKTL